MTAKQQLESDARLLDAVQNRGVVLAKLQSTVEAIGTDKTSAPKPKTHSHLNQNLWKVF